MNVESILDELRSQRTRIDRAIAALQGTARNSRPAQAVGRQRGHMSAAARARIGAAKKAWWAKQQRKSGTAKKQTLIHSAKRKPMSPPCLDRKSTRLNSSHSGESRMPSSA